MSGRQYNATEKEFLTKKLDEYVKEYMQKERMSGLPIVVLKQYKADKIIDDEKELSAVIKKLRPVDNGEISKKLQQHYIDLHSTRMQPPTPRQTGPSTPRNQAESGPSTPRNQAESSASGVQVRKIKELIPEVIIVWNRQERK